MLTPVANDTDDAGLPDAALIEEFLRRGSEEAFRILYRRHTPAVLLLARRLLGPSRFSAEDVVQETWMRAARGLKGFRGDSSLRTWIAGIAIRRCREVVRGESRRPETRLEGEGMERVDSSAEGRQLDLEREIRGLPEGCREIVVLHDIEGYTHEEIGDLLGIAPGTSKSQLFRARRTLRARLNPGGAHDRG
jgi:RNA polymerase sigma-70 factor (ECF subfamily)